MARIRSACSIWPMAFCQPLATMSSWPRSYINEVLRALQAGAINRDQFDLLAVAINTGTNIPSVATPNGQAAFLFLLTSSLAPIIRLSYGRMVWMGPTLYDHDDVSGPAGSLCGP